MWGGSGPDPGGTTKDGDPSSGTPSNQELIDLKDQFEQQQVLIAQLKEMLRKTEQTTITQEKVEEYANTLTRMSARAKKNKMRKEGQIESKGEVAVVTKTTIDTPAKEKLMLLKQQVEENKQKFAERGKFQKDIEETVTQLKAQLADSQQQLFNQTQFNVSLTEPKIENYSINSSQEELFNLVTSKDQRINELNAKIQKLEANVLDLQENVKEKDSVIDARTKAITLMSESLSKKGKTTLDALDDTKEQMRKMQENFVTLEMDMKSEKQQLLVELEEKNSEIKGLQEMCDSQKEEIAILNSSLEKHKASDDTVNLNSQIDVLNNRITELEQLNIELQEKSTGITRDSPQRSSKKGKKGQKAQKVQSKESSDDSSETLSKLAELQKQLDEMKVECEVHLNKITEHELTISELNMQIEELKAKPVTQRESEPSGDEIMKLKKQLDENNKSMIKIKAQHKGKIKELNKKIEELKKSGSNDELLKLQAENVRLSERIDVLEEQKVNLGLDESCSSSIRDSGVSERVKELEIKLIEQTELTDSKNTLIGNLEEQLESLKERFESLSHLENAQVVSEITSIHFEEQLDKLEIEKRELIKEKEELTKEHEILLEKLENLTKDKQELNSKLDSYMQENIELIDKLEKLSAEKVSSAESIEIVEGLTQQEKLELEQYQKGLEMASGNIKNSSDNLEENPELNESVNQLTEETSDLLRKIELFTEERREVMEKMEALTAENSQLNVKIHEIENNRDILADTYEHLQNEKEELESELQDKKDKLKILESNVDDLKKENDALKEKLGCQDIVKPDSGIEESRMLESDTPLKSNEENLELQMQIDEYKKLIEIQQQEIQELKLELLSQKDLAKANIDLHEKISSLQAEYETLLSENEKLNKTIKENSEIVHEKDAIALELINARKRIDEFNEKLTNNLNEIENYKSIVEENKDELISSANLINDLQTKLQEKQSEIAHYENEMSHLNSVITELNSAISHLESENHQLNESNSAMEIMSNQLQELKVLLNENIKEIEVYEKEQEQNSDKVVKLNMQLKDVNKKLLEMEHDLECKEDEIRKLSKERDNKETMIASLQAELKDKDENFHQTCNTLKEKYLTLQNRIEENSSSSEDAKNLLAKIEELEGKNKDHIEKMKKIAANLKKKSAAYQELERKYKQLEETYNIEKTEKWETEDKEKVQLQEVIQNQEAKLIETQKKMDSLLEQLQEIEKEFGTKAKMIDDLRAENEELLNLKQNYEIQLNTFTTEAELHRSTESNNLNIEINAKNEIIKNLTQELETVRYNSETSSNALHAKIQELEMFIETQEAELTKYKERVNKLEEGLSTVEDRRLSLEQKTIELGVQLLEKSTSLEEISQTEDLLEQRLTALMVHDEKMQRHLQESVVENQELLERNKFLAEENDQLKHKLSAATERNLDATTNQEKISNLQNENLRLNEVIVNLENESKRLHAEYDKKLNEKKNMVESLEMELQGHLIQLDNERKTLLVQCEQLQDKIREYNDTQELLKEDIEQYKQKLEQQQIDFDACIEQFQQVNDENKKNLNTVEKLNAELETLKASNADNSIEKLLAQKDAEIENYRQQNLQLQMQTNFDQSQAFDVFQNASATDPIIENEELQAVRNQLVESEKVIQELQTQNSQLLDKLKTFGMQVHNPTKKSEPTQQSDPPKETISTFVWPEQSDNDPFSFVLDPMAIGPQTIEQPIEKPTKTAQLQDQNVPSTSKNDRSENTKEELLKKIKTLEFLLYDIEKEKEDVLEQCHELTNEIARLIYERHNSSVESQICTETDTDLTGAEQQQLHGLEFTKTKECKDEYDSVQLKPVMEEIIEPTTTYLCYKPGTPEDLIGLPQQGAAAAAAIEPFIVSPLETSMTKGELKQLKKLEFGKTKPCKVKKEPEDQHGEAVVEDVVKPETAYLCYQLETPVESSIQRAQMSTPLESQAVSSEVIRSEWHPEPSSSLDIFDENDDGWGCGIEEARLEEDHRQQQLMGITAPINLNVNLRIEELDERVHILELERERHLEEIKQAQIKSGKLIKKLKEFKALNEKLTADLRKSSDFGGLDDAIQDELQSQIAQLEKRIKECTAELDKEKSDKNNLLKKNEMLQAANERLTEIKEKQDVEILGCQRQNRELNAKLEQFEWGDGGIDSPKHVNKVELAVDARVPIPVENLEKKIQELSDTVKDLALDNEELQAMLEEQRTLRINAEKAKSVEPILENMRSEAEYLSVVTERNQLSEQLISSGEEKKNIQEQLNRLIKHNSELEEQLQSLREEKSQLEYQIVENGNRLQELARQQDNLQIKKDDQELEEANYTIMDLEQKNSALNIQLRALEETIEQLYFENTNVSKLKNTIDSLNQVKTDLFNALQGKNVEIGRLNVLVEEHGKNKVKLEEKLNYCEVLANENKDMIKKLQSKDAQLEELTKKLDSVLEERSSLSTSIQQLSEEWSQRVDQRGVDVAESWKLHLESRENEFIQIEQQFKKDINELEEKCNALVNENNELRKNVDAEIRNEVDRVSALQQQINDRQHYINDLTRALEENQTKLEQQQQKISEYESHISQLNQQMQDKNVRITEVEAKVLSLQLEIEEKMKYIEDLSQQLEEYMILQAHLIENKNVMLKLQSDLEAKQKTIDDSNKEIEKYKESYETLQNQIQNKDLYLTELTNKLQEVQTQKEVEVNDICTLQQQISELTMHLQEKQSQIESLNQQIYNYQQHSENYQIKDVEIQELKSEINNLHSLLSEKEKENQAIVELNMEISHLKLVLNEKEKEYVNNLTIATQESENVFHEKAQELDMIKRRQAESENHYEELLMAKNADMASLQVQLQEEIHKNEALTKNHQEKEDALSELKYRLNLRECEYEDLQQKVFEEHTLQSEENKQLSELHEIIEDQVIKIEALKQELFEKSKDYDSLIAELDIRKPTRSEPSTPPPLEQQEEFMKQLRTSEISVPKKHDDQRESETSQLINRAEMDLALYMLHQRDMRCEELTVELMQLLEERDTLQLKLSNTLREKEELRKRLLPFTSTLESGDDEGGAKLSEDSITETPKKKSKASAIILGATGTELATEATENLGENKEGDHLATKLSELKSVGYRRDKTLLDEQDQRRLQQLSLMQQHRDLAAMLPPEAAAKLVQDANYTLSRDVQSPPRVLLNWLWGKSTPKVNDV